MTARDFTPTDEHMQNLAEDYAGVLGLRDDFRRGDESDAYLLVVDGLAASPAFQSIIAAAKAEALREGFMQASILVDRWGYPTLSDDLDRHSPYREADA